MKDSRAKRQVHNSSEPFALAKSSVELRAHKAQGKAAAVMSNLVYKPKEATLKRRVNSITEDPPSTSEMTTLMLNSDTESETASS